MRDGITKSRQMNRFKEFLLSRCFDRSDKDGVGLSLVGGFGHGSTVNTESIETGVLRVTMVRVDHYLNVAKCELGSIGVLHLEALQRVRVVVDRVAVLPKKTRLGIVLHLESVDRDVGWRGEDVSIA